MHSIICCVNLHFSLKLQFFVCFYFTNHSSHIAVKSLNPILCFLLNIITKNLNYCEYSIRRKLLSCLNCTKLRYAFVSFEFFVYFVLFNNSRIHLFLFLLLSSTRILCILFRIVFSPLILANQS